MARGSSIHSYQDLIVWQKAMKLLAGVQQVIRRLPFPERYDFGRQMRRAALSIPATIAEGYGPDHLGDFLRHLSFARGSVMELETELIAVRDLSLVPRHEVAPLLVATDEISRRLTSLSRKLRLRPATGPRRSTFYPSELRPSISELTVAPPRTSASGSRRPP
jgi:four helix bundle protein